MRAGILTNHGVTSDIITETTAVMKQKVPALTEQQTKNVLRQPEANMT